MNQQSNSKPSRDLNQPTCQGLTNKDVIFMYIIHEHCIKLNTHLTVTAMHGSPLQLS